VPTTTRPCKKCGARLKKEEYPVNPKTGNRIYVCDVCRLQKDDVRREVQYKLEPGELDRRFAEQEGRCAICSRLRKLVVDHCHQTGAVRGLICTPCNTGLGMFQDSVTMLKRAQLYLTQSRYARSSEVKN
jgi:hypothetical protein